MCSWSILTVPLPFYVLIINVNACINRGDEVDLTSNWCKATPNTQSINRLVFSQNDKHSCPFGHRSKVSRTILALLYRLESVSSLTSVPMAVRKHLFPFRTQKLSSSAAIILRKWETSTVPNYKKRVLIGLSFSIEIFIEHNSLMLLMMWQLKYLVVKRYIR